MRGDFARLTFDSTKHYTGVLHQQGRVWLEADWNEDVYNRQNLLWQETFDIIGACGVPDPGTAFQISPNPDPNKPFDFLIAGGSGPEGRYYVDGILAQLEQTTSYSQQPDFPNAPPIQMPQGCDELRALVYLEVWQRFITYLEDASLREIALGGPDTATRLKTIAQVKVLPAPCNQDLTCAAAELPGPGSGLLTTLQPKDRQPDDLCSLPDPSSYTGRENHLYRVEIHDGGDVLGNKQIGFAFSNVLLAQDASTGAMALTLQDVLSPGQIDALERSGVLSLTDDDGQTEIVAVTDVSTHTSATHLTLEKGLSHDYTVARHAAVSGGVARFKWSRDNASFAVHVSAVSQDGLTLTLSSLGRDQATALRDLDLVEISDDASDLGPARGHLTYLTADPDPDLLTVNLADPLHKSFSVDRHLVLRRWDGWGWANLLFDPATTPDMDLGDGVHIQFGGWDLRPGDFWQFAARTADGSVEALTDASPFGIIRHRCPLAIVDWSFQFLFDTVDIFNASQEVKLSNDQLTQLVKELNDSGKSLWKASEVHALFQNVGATPQQLSLLDDFLASLIKDQKVKARLIFTVLEDCRQPFDPLTKRCCDCTVTVAPGESLSAAFDKIRDPGGIVCLLPGVHKLTDTVTVSAKNGLTIRGAGAATIISAPTTRVLLNFQNCINLTLRDLTIASWPQISIANQPGTPVAGQPATPVSSGSPAQIVPASGAGPIDGVVTFTDCQAVRVTNCIVACAAPDGKPRTCISFLSSIGSQAAGNPLPQVQLQTRSGPGGSDTPAALQASTQSRRTTDEGKLPLTWRSKKARRKGQPAQAPGPAQAPDPTTEATGPTGDKAVSAPASHLPFIGSREFIRFSLDFTLRDCRLYADAGQFGLFVTGGGGVSVEDNWFFSLAALDPTGLETIPPIIDLNQRADTALTFVECVTLKVTNNLVSDFNIVLFANAGAGDLLLHNNLADSCGSGFSITPQESLRITDNVLSTDTGPAISISKSSGPAFLNNEVFLSGNTLERLEAGGTQNPAQVVLITADAATLFGNNFHNRLASLDFSVMVTAKRITYTSNRSVCDQITIPTGNVILLGPTDAKGTITGSITAVSNTCLEPLTAPPNPFQGALQELQRQQANLVSKYIATRVQAERQQLLQQLDALSKQEQEFAQRLKETVASGAGGGSSSLFVSSAFAVTGMNLLSNSLVHLGTGSDQGSQEGVF